MDISGEKSVEFRLQSIEDVPHSQLNVLRQTRTTYRPEGMSGLVHAIRATDTNDEGTYTLFHPLMANRLEADHATAYLQDLNLCHGTEYTLDDLTPADDGGYMVVIAGHRRRLATGEIIDVSDASRDDVTVPCSVYDNLSFSDALRKQIDENMHESLSVTETARAIQSTYRFGLAKGHYRTVADCVRDLPFGDEKVRNALKFCELPEFLQEWVEDEHLTYGAAVALYPLMKGLQAHHSDKSPEETEAITHEYLMAYGLKIIKNKWTRGDVAAQVEELTRSWLAEGEELQLFQIDAYKEALQLRRRATRELFGHAVNLFRQFRAIGSGRLFDELPLEYKEAMAAEIAELNAAVQQAVGGTALGGVEESADLFTVS